jgi:hypothetical protein
MSKYHTDPGTRAKIDQLLHMDTKNHQNLGLESTDEERLRVKRVWLEILLPEIILLDPDFAEVVEPNYH